MMSVNKDRIYGQLFEFPQSIDPSKDRALAYGDGLFETILVVNGVMQFLIEHQQRLERGLRHLKIAALSNDFWDRCICKAKNYESAVFKIIVCREPGGRGFIPASGDQYDGFHIRLFAYQRPASWLQENQTGISLHLCSIPYVENPFLAGLKHLNRIQNVLAAKEVKVNQCQEGLLLDQNKHILEGVSSNIFWFNDNCWYTPGLDSSGVKGIVRKCLLERLEVVQGSYYVEELETADEIFVCNSIQGILPVTQFLKFKQLSVGKQTRKIIEMWSAFQ
ncbi:MAG: aminodeoxychorismate lyase [bacterium]